MTVDVMAQLAIGQQFADLAAAGPFLLGILAAAVAGLVSFASPCVVPLVPGYMSYLASIVGGEVTYDTRHGAMVTKKRQWAVAGAAGLFIAGFTVVFVLATVTAFGAISMLTLNAGTLMRLGGVVTILMGVVFMGMVSALQRDTRFSPKKWSTWLGAPLLDHHAVSTTRGTPPFSSGRILVTHDPQQVSVRDLVEAVAAVGYTAKPSAI